MVKINWLRREELLLKMVKKGRIIDKYGKEGGIMVRYGKESRGKTREEGWNYC